MGRAPRWAPTFSHLPLKETCRAEDRQLRILIHTILTSEEHQYSSGRAAGEPDSTSRWMNPRPGSDWSQLSTNTRAVHGSKARGRVCSHGSIQGDQTPFLSFAVLTLQRWYRCVSVFASVVPIRLQRCHPVRDGLCGITAAVEAGRGR